jgi:CheY-like chemotaxis protein
VVPILIVDDEQAIRHSLRLALEDEGYQVLEAANGEQALAILTPHVSPMVILLDRLMPILSGDFLLLALAASPVLRQHHSIIVMTANASNIPDVVKRAIEKLNADIVTKPFNLDTLLRAVEYATTHVYIHFPNAEASAEEERL